MRTIFRSAGLICGLVVGVLTLAAPSAQAAITSLVVSGTTANLSLAVSTPGSRSDCKVDLLLTLAAATSITRLPSTTSSTGVVGFLQRFDHCTDDLQFGSFNVSVAPSAFTASTTSATLNATFPVVLDSFGPAGGTVTHTLAIALTYKALENNSTSSRSFMLTNSPGLTVISRGNSIVNAAGITGTLKVDGVNLVTAAASSDASISTGTSANIQITR